MKAAVHSRYGPPNVVDVVEVPTPTAKDHEVRLDQPPGTSTLWHMSGPWALEGLEPSRPADATFECGEIEPHIPRLCMTIYKFGTLRLELASSPSSQERAVSHYVRVVTKARHGTSGLATGCRCTLAARRTATLRECGHQQGKKRDG